MANPTRIIGHCPLNSIIRTQDGLLLRVIGRRYPIVDGDRRTMIECLDAEGHVVAEARHVTVELVKTPEMLAQEFLAGENQLAGVKMAVPADESGGL